MSGTTTIANPVVVVGGVMSASYKTLMAAAGFGSYIPCRIKHIRFVNTAAGDKFAITDPLTGNIINEGTSNGDDLDLPFDAYPVLVRDFTVSSFSSSTGSLLVWVI